MDSPLGKTHRGDCITGMRRISDGTVALVFADPPFNIGYDYDVYDDLKPAEAYLSWTRAWMQEVIRVLSPTGTFWLAIGDEYAAEAKLLAQNELGLTCRSWVVWYYTFGVNCTRKFTRSHAHLFHFVKDAKQFTFNDDAVRVPSARQLVYADSRANPRGRLPDDTWILRPQDCPDGFRADEDMWYFPRVCGTFKQREGWHGCQMPEQLLGRIIRASSSPGDAVLDPFAGSGTTLAVAKKLHRKWIGFELSKDYVKQINSRLASIQPGDSLDGAADPLASAPTTAAGRELGRPRRRRQKQAEVNPATPVAKLSRSPMISRLNLSLGQIAAASGEFTTAIAEAYLAASDGYSIDRVLADPGLNAEFRKACGDLGVPGAALEWNRRLLGLRKAGRLKSLPRARRTRFDWRDLDRFIFASEIAWGILADEKGVSLDEILCDPDLASEFDRTAGRFAPGWTPLHYRWGALTLRKQAKRKRDLSMVQRERCKIDEQFRRQVMPLTDVDRIRNEPGIYLLETDNDAVYLGETEELRSTLEVQALQLRELLQALSVPDSDHNSVRLKAAYLPNSERSQRWGEQSRRLAVLHPIGNIVDKQACPAEGL